MSADTSIPTRAGEAGSFLIEALVSAIILAGAIVGLFFALDVQGSASGNSRAASVAAGLAEQDQERLRSFRVPQLSNRHETRTVPVAGVDYTVDSDVEWIRDATGGTQSCASSSTQADYLRLTTLVTSPQGSAPKTAPIRVRSLVAPPVGQFGAGQGTLAVSTKGASGQPIEGATTTITGPTTLSDTTNELGCAVFGYVPAGAYAVTVAANGFVDPSGNATANGSGTASEGTVNLSELQYDRAGSVDVSFDTVRGKGGTPQAASSAALSAAHAKVPGTGFRLYRPTLAQTKITAAGLFPFTTPYTIYSGSCTAANPALYDADYFVDHPGSVLVGPGSSAAVTVREPALQLTVSSALPLTAIKVRARSTDAGCTDVFDWDVITDATKTATLPEPGLPFGHYSVCAVATIGGKSTTLSKVDLIDPDGSAPVSIDVSKGKGGSTCP